MKDKQHWELSQWKHPLICPYCGSEMHFHYDVYYEGSIHEWLCSECELILPDLKRFPPRYMTGMRNKHRIELKKRMDHHYKNYIRVKENYDAYGKNNPSMRNPPLVK